MRAKSFVLALTACAMVFASHPIAQNPDGTRVRATPAGPVEPPHMRTAEVGWRNRRTRRSMARA
jgi:hypothetical protein